MFVFWEKIYKEHIQKKSMEKNHYDERLDRFMNYFIPALTSGAGGYLLAEGDIKSTIFLGLITVMMIY